MLWFVTLTHRYPWVKIVSVSPSCPTCKDVVWVIIGKFPGKDKMMYGMLLITYSALWKSQKEIFCSPPKLWIVNEKPTTLACNHIASNTWNCIYNVFTIFIYIYIYIHTHLTNHVENFASFVNLFLRSRKPKCDTLTLDRKEMMDFFNSIRLLPIQTVFMWRAASMLTMVNIHVKQLKELFLCLDLDILWSFSLPKQLPQFNEASHFPRSNTTNMFLTCHPIKHQMPKPKYSANKKLGK